MKKLKTITSIKNRKIYILIFVVFFLICVSIAVLCMQYYTKVKETVKEESKSYMLEISKQMGINISKNINDNFSSLDTIAMSLSKSGVDTFPELTEAMDGFKAHWNYKKIMVIDDSLVAYNQDGTNTRLSETGYLTNVIRNKVQALSSSEMIDGVECIVFAIPSEMVIDGVKVKAFAAAYELSTFDRMISMSAFDGKGYAHIVNKDGSVVVRSSSKNAFDTGYNILASIEQGEVIGDNGMDTIKRDINAGNSGFAEIIINRDNVNEKKGETLENIYMSYSSLTDTSDTYAWRLITFVPVVAVSERSTMLLNITVMMCLTITFAFVALFVVLMIITYNGKKKLEHIAYNDDVTGGNTIQMFYERAAILLKESNKPQYALIYTDIEKFKLLNEQFGQKNCDNLLRSMYNGIQEDLDDRECMGRLFADNFCLLIKYSDEEELLRRIDVWKVNANNIIDKEKLILPNFMTKIGAYVINNDSMPISHMIDRAKLSITETVCQTIGNVKFSVYDESVRKVLIREKHIEDRMESAMTNNEFIVYLQPKYNTMTEKVGGAEALVRWKTQDEGMIFPDEFIPLFEKNGFVVKVDLFVFETVCKLMRNWLDNNQEPVKVSVNCSRVHLKNPNFILQYDAIAEKYNIPRKYLEIEFTENIVFSDISHFSKIISLVHSHGFGCSMDDFGSGFSSLSMIQDIPVDSLKLDRIFFRNRVGDSSDRTESVVASIITMANALSMTTVAEGVEERVQVDMLKRLGCNLIQGYYFAKPMPISQFEELIANENSTKEEGK